MTKQIILDGALADNSWHLVTADSDTALTDGAIVPLATWLAIRESGSIAGKRVGVWLAPADDPAELADDVARLPLIAVQFPAFTDGRGYSIGRLLRERFGFRGELRAFGDVGRDHVFNLSRCGFNAFEIKQSQEPGQALGGLADFSEGYQTSVERPVPLYRRRAHTPTDDSWSTGSAPS